MFIIPDALISSRSGSLVMPRAAAGLAYDHDVFMPCACWALTKAPEGSSTKSSDDLEELVSMIRACASKACGVPSEKCFISNDCALSTGKARRGKAAKMLIRFNLKVRPHIFLLLFDVVPKGSLVSGKRCNFPFNLSPNMFISTMKIASRKEKKYIQEVYLC